LRGDGCEETVILRTVDNVKLCARTVFIHLIIEEMRPEIKQEEIKSRIQEENKSSVMRARPAQETHQPLDEILRNMREQRHGAELEAIRFVMRRVEKNMGVDELRIIQLLNDGYKPQELAAVFNLEVKDIHKAYRIYKNNCKNLWNRLFGSS